MEKDKEVKGQIKLGRVITGEILIGIVDNKEDMHECLAFSYDKNSQSENIQVLLSTYGAPFNEKLIRIEKKHIVVYMDAPERAIDIYKLEIERMKCVDTTQQTDIPDLRLFLPNPDEWIN